MIELILTDDTTGLTFKINSSSTLGRDKTNEIMLDSSFISRFHCKFFIVNKNFYVKDLHSKNGTLVNQKIVVKETQLQTGDVISFGAPENTFSITMLETIDEVKSNTFILAHRMKIAIAVMIGILIISISFFTMNRTKNHKEPVPKTIVSFKEIPGLRELIKMTLVRLGEKPEYIDDEIVNSVEKFVQIYQKGTTYRERMKEMKKYQALMYDILSSHNLNDDYIFIAFVESGFDTKAYNRNSGAKGMWQFLSATGKSYGLKINKKVDERTDLVASTEAACLYISDMAAIFGYDSFLLISASFNCGDGTLRAALKQIKNVKADRSFFYLYKEKLIPLETREYVLKIVAAIVLTEYENLKNLL